MKTNETDTSTATAAQSTKSTVLLSIDKIRPNPNTPRRSYDENALAELAASIATHGLIQPIRVRAAEQGGYIIVCGERRYRAVQLLGQTEIEAIVDAAPADERAIFDLALSENIQREEMPPLDEAEAYKATMQTFRGDAAVAFNPFFVEDGVYDVEKRESLKALLLTLGSANPRNRHVRKKWPCRMP